MTETILGFGIKIPSEKIGWPRIFTKEEKVPVVSLEWSETQLELLLARSVWEMLPAYVWANDLARNNYNKGVRETEEAWHKIIEDLLFATKKEAGK